MQKKGGKMTKLEKKVVLEALRKILGQQGTPNDKSKAEPYRYTFACPECEKIGRDSKGNHLDFYPAKNRLVCRLDAEGIKPNEHGLKIYRQLKEELERIKNEKES